MPERRVLLNKTICICAVLVMAISGWFYLSLKVKYGSITAFNRKPIPNFSFNNQPPKFYRGLALDQIFNLPIRPNFSNQFFPMMYSDIWGDYWCYFLVYGKDRRTSEFIGSKRLYHLMMKDPVPEWLETNYNSMGAYLGRVNLVSLFPSLFSLIVIFAIPFMYLRKSEFNNILIGRKSIYAFSYLAIFFTMIGYSWFLIKYPNLNKGDTIKATYIIQIFPFMSIISGVYLSYLRKYSFIYFLIMIALLLGFFHNVFAMFTRY